MRFKAVLFIVCVMPVFLRAEEPVKQETRFMRVTKNEKGPVSLETAIAHYVPIGEKGVELDIIGAVHIGEKKYYEKLNKAFEKYDVVLYELVAPEGTRIPKGGRKDDGDSPLSYIQKAMKLVLQLEFQLDQVDYTKANFVHADLSPEGIGEAMAERGDTQTTVILGFIADMMRKQNLQQLKPQPEQPQEEFDFLDLLDKCKMRRMAAKQFEDAGEEGGLGKTINQILVQDRNKACLKVFQKQLTAGKKKIAIFYGAAHGPDFDKRLREDFGMKRVGTDWIRAWDLRDELAEIGEVIKKLLE